MEIDILELRFKKWPTDFNIKKKFIERKENRKWIAKVLELKIMRRLRKKNPKMVLTSQTP